MKHPTSSRRVAIFVVAALSVPIALHGASSLFGGQRKPFPQVLNPDQKLYMDWTERQFAQVLDQSAFANLPEAEKVKSEAQWLAALKTPQSPDYYPAINRLGAIQSCKAVKPLLDIATERNEKDNRDRWMAVRALGMIGDDSVVAGIIPLVYHYDQTTRFWAQITLARLTGVNFDTDWKKWGTWWNIQGKPPRFDFKQITWTTRPEWSDPTRLAAMDRQTIEQLRQQSGLPPGTATGLAPAPSGPPRVVSTTPAIGAGNVDPSLTEILVAFDQDMAGGFSWTGGGELYPKTTARPYWKDPRTCALPVALEGGRSYRVGINSTSHQNFRSRAGMPVRPTVIYFSTAGGPGGSGTDMLPPQVVMMTPANGAANVSPALTELRVTFDREMGGGFSWTGGGELYPEVTSRPHWSPDRKTCILPVKLKPNWSYRLGLNSPSHINFQSAKGVPLKPVLYTFQTGAQ